MTKNEAKNALLKAGLKLGTRTQKIGRLKYRSSSSELADTYDAVTKPSADPSLKLALIAYVAAELEEADQAEKAAYAKWVALPHDASWGEQKRLSTRHTWAGKHHREVSRVWGWLTNAE